MRRSTNTVWASHRSISRVFWGRRPVDEAAYRDQYGFGEKIVCDGRE